MDIDYAGVALIILIGAILKIWRDIIKEWYKK